MECVLGSTVLFSVQCLPRDQYDILICLVWPQPEDIQFAVIDTTREPE